MQNDTVTIYCPNPLCQAPNPESHRFCQQCRTAIPKRYLWAVGKGLELLRPGELLSNRYVLKCDRIVLDTQPGLLPDSPDDISDLMEAYLRLAPFQLHVPQIYGIARMPQKRATPDILLLERVPVYPEVTSDFAAGGSFTVSDTTAHSLEGQLMPALTDHWQHSNAMRQLHWLWQIAHLWQPLSTLGVATTLLQPECLRVEGALLRLLELQPDRKNTPPLAYLGKVWEQWQPAAAADSQNFMAQCCQQMQQGQVSSVEQLIAMLDRALAMVAQSQSRQILLATQTDQGPTRQRNEDACYPPTGTVLSFANPAAKTPDGLPLVVVCDGIGGHEGGDVASSLAIAIVQQKAQVIPQSMPLDAGTLTTQLEQATLLANDLISQRNDNEQRQERQRMGTTLVMALVNAHELYLTHVGDSRAYRVTATGCHQVTLDDDLAAREVRLGYALYREALRQPGAGSLVQALGMSASSMLHPTIQRFVLDEDCLFLLCSDGLSDHDRVEANWQTELLPVLEGKVDIATATQRLIGVANTQNGHDNVTVGLIHCRVTVGDRLLPVSLDTLLEPLPGETVEPPRAMVTPAPTAPVKTVMMDQRQHRHPLPLLLGSIALLLGVGFATYLLVPQLHPQNRRTTSASPTLPESVPPLSPPPPPTLPSPPSIGSLVQVVRLAPSHSGQAVLLPLLAQPGRTAASSQSATTNIIPADTILQVDRRQLIAGEGNWLKLKVCAVPTTTATGTNTVIPGETGWLEETAIAPLVTQELSLSPPQLKLVSTYCTISSNKGESSKNPE